MWTDGKTTKQIEDELWRQMWTYDTKTLRDLLFNALSPGEKKDWVNAWHENDEEAMT